VQLHLMPQEGMGGTAEEDKRAMEEEEEAEEEEEEEQAMAAAAAAAAAQAPTHTQKHKTLGSTETRNNSSNSNKQYTSKSLRMSRKSSTAPCSPPEKAHPRSPAPHCPLSLASFACSNQPPATGSMFGLSVSTRKAFFDVVWGEKGRSTALVSRRDKHDCAPAAFAGFSISMDELLPAPGGVGDISPCCRPEAISEEVEAEVPEV
jgi:hypothetical protein